MTTLVQWVLDTVFNQYPGTYPDSLIRQNRDDSLILDEFGNPNLAEPHRTRESDLSDGNIVAASSDPLTSTTPIGFGYDHQVDTGVSVRVEGLHEDEYGHIADSDEFATLVDDVKQALLSQRQYPTGDYHTLFIRESDNQNADHRDYFREDFDVLFAGYDELP